MTTPRDLVLLGSTGSIGTQALDVVSRNRDAFRVVGLAAGGSDVALLARQALEHSVQVVAVARGTAAQDLQLALYAEAQKRGYSSGEFRLPKILAGPDAATEVAGWPCHTVLNGMTGSVGLAPTLAALDAGAVLALANKESLIVGGPLVLEKVGADRESRIVPVDSEHSAIAQCLRGGRRSEVRRLVLTASGGPFRGRSKAELAVVTVEQSLEHPNFAMGPVITVNSSTLVNKGLEVIEAHLLFDIGFDDIDVVVHPQQQIHSMVEFHDGSTLAQLGPPSMLVPIALGIGWPDRVPGAGPPADWTAASTWSFEPVDHATFPAVQLAAEAGRTGGTAPAVLNAANEEAVAGFLAGKLAWPAIVDTVAQVVSEHTSLGNRLTLADVLDAEAWARERSRQLCGLAPGQA